MTPRTQERDQDGARREHGSALVLAIFVLVMLTGMGTALLFLSQSEVRMSRANLRVMSAFYYAEAGLEDGRASLYAINKGESFDDDLATAAGSDGDVDFDPDLVHATWDAGGNPTGFTGFDDDVPLAATAFGGGMYAVFLTNDPVDGRTNLVDSNDRVMLTGIGAGPDHSFEIVQAIIEIHQIFPSSPPATITMLGPSPDFDGGSSSAKHYVGDDCNGSGIPGLFAPVLGAIGSSAAANPCPGSGSVTCGIVKPGTFDTGYGLYGGFDTAADVSDPGVFGGIGPIAPEWLDCAFLQDLVEDVRAAADVVCTPPSSCTLPPDDPARVVFVDGDWTLGPTDAGHGLLFVTGTLTMHGQTDWNGMIYVVGEGVFIRSGAGNGVVSGAMFVADIAGNDNIYGTGDDCSGGTDGFQNAGFDESGGGTGDTIYCTDDITPALPVKPYEVVDFLQR